MMTMYLLITAFLALILVMANTLEPQAKPVTTLGCVKHYIDQPKRSLELTQDFEQWGGSNGNNGYDYNPYGINGPYRPGPYGPYNSYGPYGPYAGPTNGFDPVNGANHMGRGMPQGNYSRRRKLKKKSKFETKVESYQERYNIDNRFVAVLFAALEVAISTIIISVICIAVIFAIIVLP